MYEVRIYKKWTQCASHNTAHHSLTWLRYNWGVCFEKNENRGRFFPSAFLMFAPLRSSHFKSFGKYPCALNFLLEYIFKLWARALRYHFFRYRYDTDTIRHWNFDTDTILILYGSNYTDTIPILQVSKNPDTDTIPILRENDDTMYDEKIWICYFKLFIAIKPFQNNHNSEVFGATPPLILKLIRLS